jgi:hypothetical protein
MEYGKAALAVVLITLSIVGFGLTWFLFVIFRTWKTEYPFDYALRTVGYAMVLVLPTLTGMFSLMFMLLGIYLLYQLYQSTRQPENIDQLTSSSY